MANLPRLKAVLKRDAPRSAWIMPLAMVYWPYTTTPCILLLSYTITQKGTWRVGGQGAGVRAQVQPAVHVPDVQYGS